MQQTSRSHAPAQPQPEQPLPIAEFRHGRGLDRGHNTSVSTSKPDAGTQNPFLQVPGRGRTMRRRYDFTDSDDKSCTEDSPVEMAADKKNTDVKENGTDNIGRQSTMTTMTDIMRQGRESSPPEVPVRRNRLQQAIIDVGNSATQQSSIQPKTKPRPAPLDLNAPAFVGSVTRNQQRYNVEHNPIRSSQADFFDGASHYPSSSVYDDDDQEEASLTISPLHIPRITERSVNFQDVYNRWRQDLRPIRTASQGSIHITVPTAEDDTVVSPGVEQQEDCLSIADYPVSQESPTVNRMRSQSSLGFREDRTRQFPGDFEAEAEEYGAALASGLPSGVKRSATTNSVPNRQFSGYSTSHSQQSGRPRSMAMGDVASSRLEVPPSPYTPLTPFIMRATGAPSCIERGSKNLFGDRGWLEDTAASGPKNPKVEKTGGFMENLKQKARKLVSHIFYYFSSHSYYYLIICEADL